MWQLALLLMIKKLRWQSVNMRFERSLQPNHSIDHGILYLWPSLLIVTVTAQRKALANSTGTLAFKSLPFKRFTEGFFNLLFRSFESIKYVLVFIICIPTPVNVQFLYQMYAVG